MLLLASVPRTLRCIWLTSLVSRRMLYRLLAEIAWLYVSRLAESVPPAVVHGAQPPASSSVRRGSSDGSSRGSAGGALV